MKEPNKDPISLTAEFSVIPEQLEAAITCIKRFVAEVHRHERGRTLLYKSFQYGKDHTSFLHIMTFRDVASQKQHQEAEHTRIFVAQLYPLCYRLPVFKNVDEILE